MLRTADIRKVLVDGEEWGHWRGYQLPVSTQYVTIWTPIGTSMYWKPGTWVSQKHAIMYFWTDQWYTIHVSYHEDGSFASGYCDVVLPTAAYTSDSQQLVYVDLYIDVVIREDFSVYTKDQDVYNRAAQRYPIVEQSRKQAFATLDWVEEQAKNWTGPFAAMPKQLPVTNFEHLDPQEAQKIMRSLIG